MTKKFELKCEISFETTGVDETEKILAQLELLGITITRTTGIQYIDSEIPEKDLEKFLAEKEADQ